MSHELKFYDEFVVYLKLKGLSTTYSRRHIAMSVIYCSRPLTVTEIKARIPSMVTRQTIRATLKLLIDAGLVDEIKTNTGYGTPPRYIAQSQRNSAYNRCREWLEKNGSDMALEVMNYLTMLEENAT